MNARQIHWIAFVAAIGLGFSSIRADDPPDRLEKKPAPAEPKPPELPKPVDKNKDKPKEDAPAEDPEKLREKIAEDMQSAEKKLKDRDPGRDTRELQDRALRNIDKLIDLARNPPPPQPPPMGGSPPPMGGSPPPMGGEQQPQGGKPQSPSSQSRRERREQRRKQMQQQARGGGQQSQSQSPSQPSPKSGGSKTPMGNNAGQPGMGGINSDRQPDHLSDVVKDFWGHLPETLRQDVDHYYRDRFMPRYRDLLQEYYGRIAEQDRTRREDR